MTCCTFKATFTEDSSFKAKFSEDGAFKAAFGEGIPIYPADYTGATEVIPSSEAQTLETAGLMLTKNITIAPIPNNYGLITWNGSTLTVS